MNKMCKYQGKILEANGLGKVPKRITCPECKRRMKPAVEHCGCGWKCACFINVFVPIHKIKKWWKH